MSLRLKTIIGIGIIEAVLLLILITTVLNYMRDTSYRDMENYISTTTTLFSTATQDAVLSQDLASLETFIEEILKNKGVLYARISDSENIILAEGGDSSLLKPIISVDTSIEKISNNIFNSKKEIIIDDEIYGRVYIGFSTKNIQIALDDAKKMAASIAIVEMLLVAIFSFALGIYLTRQLKVLRNFAAKVSKGDFGKTIKITSKDELAEVAQAFNTMVSNLNESQQQTKKYQDEILLFNYDLEDKIKQRTQQLSTKNNELESAYEKLQATQEQLIHSEKLASIGQLAAGVAHEINNPVAFIKGNLNALKGYIKSYQQLIKIQQTIIKNHDTHLRKDDEQSIIDLDTFIDEEDIEFITEDIATLLDESIEGTDRVIEIVKGLKVYSRGQPDGQTPVDINTCLKNTLNMLNNEIKYKCEVKTVWGDLPETMGDEGKLSQVFTNLIMNASQAITDQGTITITTSINNDLINISVKDTGKGIPKENLRQLFDPFFTTKPVGEGTGLGLAISEGIIEDHKGHIHVSSEEGKGTEFVITLPIKKTAEA